MATKKNQTANEGVSNAGGGTTGRGTETNANPTDQLSSAGSGSAGSGGEFSGGAGSTSGGSTQSSGAMGSSSGGGMTGTSGSGGAATGTAVARSLYDQAKETAGHAYEVAAEKATTKLEEQKSTLSGGLASVAGSVRKVSENLRGPDVQDGISKFTAEYSETAAKKIEGIANYFEQKSVSEMYTDVERFARRNPAVFVGGAFALGLLLSRFLKSGSGSSGSHGSRGYGSSGSHDGPISTASDEGSGQGVQGIDLGNTRHGSSMA